MSMSRADVLLIDLFHTSAFIHRHSVRIKAEINAQLHQLCHLGHLIFIYALQLYCVTMLYLYYTTICCTVRSFT